MASLQAFACGMAVIAAVLTLSQEAVASGFVEKSDGNNEAFLVGVGHGLQGLDIDIDNLAALASHKSYRYNNSILEEKDGTVKAVADGLTRLADKAGDTGTFFFYFTGHGNIGSIWPQDKTMKIEEIRAAIEAGRQKPLKRLVMMFDTCHAGSLLDPVRRVLSVPNEMLSAMFADSVYSTMASARNGKKYWDKLMVFASSRADESSFASPDGSIYTLAMMKAFNETVAAKGTVGEFQALSEKYTTGHHPVARFVPDSLSKEKLVD